MNKKNFKSLKLIYMEINYISNEMNKSIVSNKVIACTMRVAPLKLSLYFIPWFSFLLICIFILYIVVLFINFIFLSYT